MCGKSPKPDPAVGQAAMENAAIAKEQAAVSREQLAFEKEQWAKYDPYYQKMLDDSIKDAASNRERSDDAWNTYKTTFKPIEERYAQEAMTYDSPEEVARRTGAAAGTVQQQIDLARESGKREAARMGVSADRTAAGIIDDTNIAGLAKAGAVNQERTNTKLTGMAMREAAANFGRGLPSIGLAAGQAATAGQTAGQNTITSQTGNRLAGFTAANAPMSTAVNANNSTANIYNEIYKGQVAQKAGQGQMVGAGIGAVATIAAVMI
jgi:hypothetical protein